MRKSRAREKWVEIYRFLLCADFIVIVIDAQTEFASTWTFFFLRTTRKSNEKLCRCKNINENSSRKFFSSFTQTCRATKKMSFYLLWVRRTDTEESSNFLLFFHFSSSSPRRREREVFPLTKNFPQFSSSSRQPTIPNAESFAFFMSFRQKNFLIKWKYLFLIFQKFYWTHSWS